MNYLEQNLKTIKSQIRMAEKAAGQKEGSVKLLAVSKTVTADIIAQMNELGQASFGENRPQALRDKSAALADKNIEWHMIGNLQTNKIKYVYQTAKLVHSIDKTELLDAFINWKNKTNHICPVLLEVHISNEEAKHGFAPEEVIDIIKAYGTNPALDIRGLMGMAPLDADNAVVRASFKKLKNLFEESKKLQLQSYHAIELSMGMSGDFITAIEEGATIVRIGSALFKTPQ